MSRDPQAEADGKVVDSLIDPDDLPEGGLGALFADEDIVEIDATGRRLLGEILATEDGLVIADPTDVSDHGMTLQASDAGIDLTTLELDDHGRIVHPDNEPDVIRLPDPTDDDPSAA